MGPPGVTNNDPPDRPSSRDHYSRLEESTERTPLLTAAGNYQRQTTINRQFSERVETVKMTLKEYLREIKVPVYILTMIFAIASWVDINGVWTEMPLLVNVLPESWNLPSYLTIIIQVANIGPIAYTIANRLAPNKVKEWPVVYIIIGVGAVSCCLLVFFWDKTSVIGGQLHSTGLLILSSFLALVDCTSSVVFLPYMAMYKPQYMTAYYIGEGLSGMIPGLVGLGQGVSQDPICRNTSTVDPITNATEWAVIPEYPPPRFSIETFWWILFAMICLSGISFSFLHWLRYCRTERIASSLSYNFDVPDCKEDFTYSNNSAVFDEEKLRPIDNETVSIRPLESQNPYHSSSSEFTSEKQLSTSFPEGGVQREKLKISKGEFAFYLTMVGLACGLTNGVMPAIQSFSCLPYGNLAYTLAIRLGSVANPIACLIALFSPPLGMMGIGILTFLGSGFSAYQIFLAAASPSPPLQGQDSGVALVILTSVFLVAFLSYVKVAVAVNLRDVGGHDALLWCGVVTQVGSFVGAIITFICVNVLKLLTQAPPCPV